MIHERVMPLGIDSFEKIRTEGYYYVDKTGVIGELLGKTFEVNLITRPRRFGKTLTMDTLACFFDIRRDSRGFFAGLDIDKEKQLCKEWQNQWPVIFLTLKEAEGRTCEIAVRKLAISISDLYKQHSYLLKSDKVDPEDIEMFKVFQYKKADEIDLQNSLYILMRMMNAHFGKQVIILIDEYDVPLAKAGEKGFYDEMLEIIRGLMSKTLKSNPFLKFCVVTGCLRIAKESIFTGTNNFVSDTITGERFNEYFGFTSEEVARLLQDTGFPDRMEEVRQWYDGYHFGSIDIYCPWDVLNHVNAIQDAPNTLPKNYWEDTSHNGILRTFIETANNGRNPELNVNDQFETLLAGGYIEETIEENLTYDTLHSSESNLWSLLYLTGYLTQAGEVKSGDRKLMLKIPNEEVKIIFQKTVMKWFCDKIVTIDRSELFWAENPWLKWAMEIQSIAQNGLTYVKDVYDKERYEQLRGIAADMISFKSGISSEQVKTLFCNETGYQTPKLDSRAAIFQERKILLVHEKNGTWSLPGGWVDVLESVASNTIKEVREEAGLLVTADRMIAVQDRNRHNQPIYAYGICKVFILCSVVGGSFQENIETTEIGYFAEDDLPRLAEEKCNEEQIRMCFAAYRDPNWQVIFD